MGHIWISYVFDNMGHYPPYQRAFLLTFHGSALIVFTVLIWNFHHSFNKLVAFQQLENNCLFQYLNDKLSFEAPFGVAFFL